MRDGDDDVDEPEPAPPPHDAARRKRLPDVDEISPSLSEAPALPDLDLDGPPPAARRRGVRLGFLGVLAVALVALGVYLYALGQPDPGPMLGAYVEAVDRGRVALADWLDDVMRSLTQMMSGVADASPRG